MNKEINQLTCFECNEKHDLIFMYFKDGAIHCKKCYIKKIAKETPNEKKCTRCNVNNYQVLHLENEMLDYWCDECEKEMKEWEEERKSWYV